MLVFSCIMKQCRPNIVLPKTVARFFLAACFGVYGCASQKEKVSPTPSPKQQISISQELMQYSCPTGNFQGSGIAGDYNQALDIAVSQIAVQIQSSVKSVNILSKTSDIAADGSEQITENFQTKSKVSAEIRNRQDVHVFQTIARDGVVGIVACLDRNDAVKPFRMDYQSARDQLVSTMAILNATNHPLEKFTNYKNMVKAYDRYRETAMVLQSLEGDEGFGDIENDYRKALDAYNDFRSKYKIYMDGAIETDEGRFIFAEISKSIKLQSLEDSCEAGVVLELEISDPKCKEGSLGVICSELIALNGKSCAGETYFTLGGSFKGVGRRDEVEARERLLSGLSRNDFMAEWLKEINRWVAR